MKNFFLHNREAALAVIVVALALLIGLRAPVFLTPGNLIDVLTIVDLHGNQAAYRAQLVQEIGQAAVEALEQDNAPRKWTREELIAIRDTYKKKLKELKA